MKNKSWFPNMIYTTKNSQKGDSSYFPWWTFVNHRVNVLVDFWLTLKKWVVNEIKNWIRIIMMCSQHDSYYVLISHCQCSKCNVWSTSVWMHIFLPLWFVVFFLMPSVYFLILKCHIAWNIQVHINLLIAMQGPWQSLQCLIFLESCSWKRINLFINICRLDYLPEI